eukprot:12165302-Prorocentrum_lima.AAC.1
MRHFHHLVAVLCKPASGESLVVKERHIQARQTLSSPGINYTIPGKVKIGMSRRRARPSIWLRGSASFG